MRILLVAGARPNFMKIKPVYEQLSMLEGIEPLLMHTGQHYDRRMSEVFFQELGIPEPDVNLGIGSGSHTKQTAEIMLRFEPVLEEMEPDIVVVVGDVNSTLACSLVCAKSGIPVAHVEAGLRSRNWEMPEEVNRVLTDRLAELLFTPSRDADENLLQEGIPAERIHFVGNVMVDTLDAFSPFAEKSAVMDDLSLEPQTFGLVTLHRPSNVDSHEAVENIAELLLQGSQRLPLVFPVHPRTRGRLEEHGLWPRLKATESLRLVKPLGYIDFLRLMQEARLAITDSGGIQEETTVLGVPCLTFRAETERPVTISEGTNRLVGTDADVALAAVDDALAAPMPEGRRPELWDGQAAGRIAEILVHR